MKIIFATLFFIALISCNKKGSPTPANTSVTAPVPNKIGQSYQGGIIAYIFKLGDPGYIENEVHGIIASPTDINTLGAPWGCFNTQIAGADKRELYTGKQNTIDIINGCQTIGIAAKLCDDYSINSYTDWYLPSIDELYKLYIKKDSIGNFTEKVYWSSTEEDNGWANCVNFKKGAIPSQFTHDTKDHICFIRPIRYF